jgi:hypothetical protein
MDIKYDIIRGCNYTSVVVARLFETAEGSWTAASPQVIVNDVMEYFHPQAPQWLRACTA